MANSVNIGGAWRSISKLHTNIDGTWHDIKKGFVNVNGGWREFYADEVNILYIINQGTLSGNDIINYTANLVNQTTGAYINTVVDAFKIESRSFQTTMGGAGGCIYTQGRVSAGLCPMNILDPYSFATLKTLQNNKTSLLIGTNGGTKHFIFDADRTPNNSILVNRRSLDTFAVISSVYLSYFNSLDGTENRLFKLYISSFTWYIAELNIDTLASIRGSNYESDNYYRYPGIAGTIENLFATRNDRSSVRNVIYKIDTNNLSKTSLGEAIYVEMCVPIGVK